ncbi:MAG: GntR family transcriptional regulator [Spirochaetales bacterium]|nr:MAG: GntR family transcriptional regulator [Spirochaetales bacterium]
MSAIRRTIVSVEVYEEIKKALFNGEWAPGERINRKGLAERFGISQTPINDALNRLTGEGLLESHSRDGFFVPDYTDAELADLFTARAGFESIAARLCAEDASAADRMAFVSLFEAFGETVQQGMETAYLAADKEFHRMVINVSGSSRLMEVETSFGLFGRSYEHGLVRSPSDTLAEHRDIVGAIVRGDGRAAQLGMAEHLLATRRYLLKGKT